MQTYVANRERLIATMPPGDEAARALSALTDRAVADLVRAAPQPPGRFTVCALGGWGAGGLLPGSDLDLLVLTTARERDLEPFLQAVLYPLWDAGLTVGHIVRSPREHRAACRSGELATLTASLTGRAIAGDLGFGEQVLDEVARDAKRRSRSLLRRLTARPRPGSPFLLEPDLKEGAGGRRDYDELVWIAAIVSGAVARDPQQLVTVGLLTPAELTAVRESKDVIAAARWELQRGGRREVLDLDAAEDLNTDAEAIQRALATTWVTLNRIRRRVQGRDVDDATPLTLEEVRELASGDDAGLSRLLEAAYDGRLDHAWPGFSTLMTTRRPGLGHTLTVGAHCIATARNVTALERAPDAALRRSADLVTDRDAMLVAALAHDVGKAEPGPQHAERSAAPARQAALAWGLPPSSADSAAELARLHLLLVETAVSQDLADEDVVLRTAARIGRRELVAPLHLLTAADSLATGPTSWTPWLASLIAELVSKLDAALSPEVDGAGLVERAERVRQAALARVADRSPGQRSFIEHASARYLANRSVSQVLEDAASVAALKAVADEQRVLIGVSAGKTADTATVTIVARDRPHLLSAIAGALALSGLDILAVDAFGAGEGVALDTFTVRSVSDGALSPDVFALFERRLRAALTDRFALIARLAERRTHYKPAVRMRPQVHIASDGWSTTVSVSAADRPGLLHDIAAAVTETGLDIRWARVRTVDGVARDVFSVVGPDGTHVVDQGVLGHLAARLREIR